MIENNVSFHLHGIVNKKNYKDRQHITDYQRLGVEGKIEYKGAAEKLFGVMEMFYTYLLVVLFI